MADSIRRITPKLMAVTASAALLLTACGGSGEVEGSGDFDLLIHTENDSVPRALESLAAGECSAENEEMPLQVETVPQTNLDQQLQLRAGQAGLPTLFASSNAPALTEELADGGHILDLREPLEETGAIEHIEPAAIETIESLYGGFRTLPIDFTIEGFWYNKAHFAEHGVEVPETWDDLVAAAETLDDAGLTAFSASGEQGWPLTRLIGNYIFRDLGPDALKRVDEGEASLSDPEYVAAAEEVAELGEAGYFGQGVGSVDMDGSVNEFLNGNAAMIYTLSSALNEFTDDELNQIGEESIGFFPFPDVEGGEGSRDQLGANVGIPVSVNANTYDDGVQDWLTCMSENYGAAGLEENRQVTGFIDNEGVEVSPLVEMVQDEIAEVDETVLWFEAFFSAAATTTSQQNASQLVTGSITAEEFMELVQGDL